MATPQPVFIIAISGCSSAGKSTLAFLLSEIFTGLDVQDNDTNGSVTKQPRVPIIHGDEFFMPKHLCPLVTYTSTPNDTAFCQASLKDDEIGEYVISWNGTRANDPFMTYTPPISANASTTGGTTVAQPPNLPQNYRVPSDESIQTTFSVASTLHEGGHIKIFTISGPGTDCDEAVNFVRMFEALKNAWKSEVEDVSRALGTMNIEHDTKSDSDSEDGGVALSSQTSEHSPDGGASLSQKKQEIEDLAQPFPHLVMDLDALRVQYADLINEMKEKVQKFLVQSSQGSCHTSIALPKVAIIESFLLFSAPSSISASDSNPNTGRLLGIFHSFLEKLQTLSTKLEEKGGIDEELENERWYIEKNLQTVNSVCKRGMMEHFNVKLWLATSRSSAKQRRFNRAAYLDTNEGGLREPGQMWKTEGYFDQIVWKHHLEKHEWLVGEDGGNEVAGELGAYKEGVHIRAQDLGVEDTVRWAVGAVLEEMGKVFGVSEKSEEGEGKVSCGGCEECGGKVSHW